MDQHSSDERNSISERNLKHSLAYLKLDRLDDAWVQDIWDREFMDDLPLPSAYAEYISKIDIKSCINNMKNNITNLNWNCVANDNVSLDTSNISGDESICSDSWKIYVNIIKHEKLIALLFSLINKGDNNIEYDDQRECAIASSRLYLVMLSIPGSKAYKVFHSQMYITCLKIFKFPDKMFENESKFDTEICDEVNSTNKLIRESLAELSILLKKFYIKSDDVCLEETISCLIDLANNYIMTKSNRNIDNNVLIEVKDESYNCIDDLIKNNDEDPDILVLNQVFKFLKHKFIASDKCAKKSIKIELHTAGYIYCGVLLSKYGDTAIGGFTCLIQHLCCDSTGMERADNRKSRVNLIAGLLSYLQQQTYVDQLKWIVKLSRNPIANWRSLALDVIGFILDGEDRNIIDGTENVIDTVNLPGTEEDTSSNEDEPSITIKRINVGYEDLVEVVVERCEDVSCTVRTNALTILVSCTSPKNETLSKIVKDLFKNYDVLVKIAEQKLKDERVHVRRSAIKLLDNLLTTRGELLHEKNLNLLVVLCRDSSILVRTLAINTLTGLAIHWHCSSIANAWLDGVMNQLSDPETKIQDIVIDALRTILLLPLNKYEINTSVSSAKFPWILLNAFTVKNMRRHLSRACLMISKQANNILTCDLVKILFTHVKTENNLSCWVLLSCIARFVHLKDISFVINYFGERKSDSMFGDIRLLVLVLEVLCEWCPVLSNEKSASLQEELVSDLHFGMIPSGATRGAVSLALRLTRDNDYSWAQIIMEEYQNKILSVASDSDEHIDVGGAIIVTMGDLALVANKKPLNEIIDLLSSMVGSFGDSNCGYISTATRAAALAVLGKFSLRDKLTAARVMQLCGCILSSIDCPLPLKINAMCFLADTSIRFTSIVEPILPSMFLCLANPDISVRRMAVQLVTQLLVADFLKLRDALYFHYFTLICDPDEKIRDIATYYILQCLIVKDKNVLFHNFVKCVFYFNNYDDPLSYKKFQVPEEERRLFTMAGEEKRAARHTIYGLMLNHMSDLQRLNTQVRLCEQALTAGEVGIAGTDLLSDTLVILRKLSLITQNREQNSDLATRVTSNIVAQKMKSNDIEKVVPLVMRLYRQLKLIDSPLVSNLVSYACDLLKEYRNEFQVEEIFDSDVNFLNEIRQFQSNTDSAAEPGAEPGSSRKERRPSKMKSQRSVNKDERQGPSRAISSSSTPKKRITNNDKRSRAKRTLNLTESHLANDDDDDDDS